MVANATGLYAHVTKIRLNTGSDDYDNRNILSSESPGDKVFYKIEYWQLYSFNEAHAGPAGEHEGDWTTVQLLYNPLGGINEDSIEAVYHYEHGKLQLKFKMPSVTAAFDHPMEPATDRFVDFRGSNFGEGCSDASSGHCNDNTIIFAQDPATMRFTHPVVYIENGGHEPWPTNEGFFTAASGHNGDDIEHSYLTKTPPNLGEVEFPFDVPGAMQIMQFNGSWGAQNGGAKGPSLHWEWTWPENSAVRWLIPADCMTD